MAQDTQNLLAALQMFGNSMQDLGISRSMRNAAEQAQKINQQEGDEFKKRQARSQLGQDLAMSLTGLGANASQVQAAFGAIAPQTLNTPEQFFSQAAQASSPRAAAQYSQAGQNVQKQVAAAPLTTAQSAQNRLQERGLTLQALALKNQGLAMGAGGTAAQGLAGSAGGKPLTADEIKKIQDLDDEIMNLQDLHQTADLNPDFTGLSFNYMPGKTAGKAILNPDFDVFKKKLQRLNDNYRRVVTGAGAPMAEIDRLLQANPRVGDPTPNFKRTSREFIMKGEETRSRYIENLARAGKDVSKYATEPVSDIARGITSSPIYQQAKALEAQLARLVPGSPGYDPEKIKQAQQRINDLKKVLHSSD